MLDAFVAATDITIFYRGLWRCLVVSSTLRLPALNYLLGKLPRDKSAKGKTNNLNSILRCQELGTHSRYMNSLELEPFLPEKSTLVLTGLEKALQDKQVLVQRAALELLNLHFPLQLR